MSQGYNSLDFNNIYKNWIQNQIETATAKGLLPEGATRFLQNERVKSIDNIINKAFQDLQKPNRGVIVGKQPATSLGPTSQSTPKQLPKVWEPNFILGEGSGLNISKEIPSKIKSLPTVIQGGVPIKAPVKPMLDPITLGVMGLQAMYGRRSNGELGAGAQLLQQTPWGQLIYGKPQPDPMMVKAEEEARRKNKEIIDWFTDKFDKGKKPSSKNNNLPPLEIIGNEAASIGKKAIPGQTVSSNSTQYSGVQSPIQLQPDDVISEQQPNIDVINSYMQQLKDVNQPYIDALQNYLNNYDDLYKRNYNAQRYWAAMSGLAKNPSYSRVADSYNPLVQEANRLNAIKQLQQAQAGDVNAINEMMGNLAAVQQMGLTPETAFANKNLLTMMAAKDREDNRLQIALENNLMKKYGIDRNYARALTVQAMRNQGAMDRAILNAQTYGYGGYQSAPGLNARGQAVTPQNLTMEQILQQAAKQNK